MSTTRLLAVLLFTALAGCTSVHSLGTPEPFDTEQIEDAVLLVPEETPVSGRAALLALARSSNDGMTWGADCRAKRVPTGPATCVD